MRILASTKIAIGLALIAAAAYFGYNFYAANQVEGLKFEELRPGRVTLLGINTGAGYRIRVSNQIAHLMPSSDEDFKVGDMSTESESEGDKRRIPLDELLKTLQGDEKALDKLILTMNEDLLKAQMPADPVVWEAADIQKALDGDEALRKRLGINLAVDLEGRPVEGFTRTAILEGIVIRAPVPVSVSVNGRQSKLTGHVMLPYRPAFARDVERRILEHSNPTNRVIAGFALEEMRKLEESGAMKEDVAKALSARIDPDVLKRYAEAPSKVLRNAHVVLNERFVVDASYKESETFQGKALYKIVLKVNEEGRKRLWQYSRRHAGEQLLFVVDGVAIAAPRIRHEITQGEVTITQIPEPTLVRDTVDIINGLKEKT